MSRYGGSKSVKTWDRVVLQNFIKKNSVVDPLSGCWLWKFPCKTRPSIRVDGKKQGAHRVAAWAFLGVRLRSSKLRGVICHECDVKQCVSPQHVYSGTQKQNVADAYRNGKRKLRTLCLRGHRLLRICGYRRCRECHRDRERVRRNHGRNGNGHGR